MSAVRSSNIGILCKGGWEKIDFNARTENAQKICLYHLSDLTTEKINRAFEALKKQVAETEQKYQGEIGHFQRDIITKPYLVQRGNSLYLITEQKKSEMMKDYYEKFFQHPGNAQIKIAMEHSLRGQQLASSDNFHEALEEYQNCLDILMTLNDKKCLAGTHYNIGHAHQMLFETEKAREHFFKCLELANDLSANEKEHFVRSSYLALGEGYMYEQKKDLARLHFREYLEVATEQNAQEDIQKAHRLIQLASGQNFHYKSV